MNVIIKAKVLNYIFQGKLLDKNGVECDVKKLKEYFTKSHVSSEAILELAKKDENLEVIEVKEAEFEVYKPKQTVIEKTDEKPVEKKTEKKGKK